MSTISPQELMQRIEHYAVSIIPYQQLEKKIASAQQLTIKLGMDPTAPDLHLGHAIVLNLMRAFQDAGHRIVFIIGNFTASIGDPTGKSKTRPALSTQEIDNNTTTYLAQVGKILDLTRIHIRYNNDWLGCLNAQDIISLCSKVTLARIIERQDFKNRFEAHTPIGMHELLYPLMQGYDSVALKADIELGGTDQTFNLLMGRHLQEAYDQEPQVIITTPLLEGLSGAEKMSKSLNNYISLNESPQSAYAKIMSIDDERMWHYYELLGDISSETLVTLKIQVSEGQEHPMTLKKSLAAHIIGIYWGREYIADASSSFEDLFQKKDYSNAQIVLIDTATQWPLSVLSIVGLVDHVSSKTHLRRLIADGAIKINGQTKKDYQERIVWCDDMTIKLGKHQFFRLKK